MRIILLSGRLSQNMTIYKWNQGLLILNRFIFFSNMDVKVFFLSLISSEYGSFIYFIKK